MDWPGDAPAEKMKKCLFHFEGGLMAAIWLCVGALYVAQTSPEYKEYTDKTPIIIPLLPIYHLNKQK